MAKLRQVEIDFEHVENVTGNDPEFMAEILEMIVEQTPGVLSEINGYFNDQAYSALGSAAHKYKSSVNILGNSHINTLLKNLENEAVGDANPANLKEFVTDLNETCNGMMYVLQNKLDTLN